MHRLSKHLFLMFTIIFATTSCASFDRVAATKFEPIKTENKQAYFRFTAYADLAYPLDSNEAEKTRIGWLEQWLSDNGYAGVKYEILSRKSVLRNKGLIGDVYDIYYDVRVETR